MFLGASEAEQINPENSVDIIQIVEQAGQTVLQYRLSQDVPGGRESNILVVRNGNVLRPEIDYSIDHNVITGLNDLITFTGQVSVYITDKIFVIHKGAATYRMAPSPGSVTDDSLSDNLRDFVFETFTGNNGTTYGPLIKQEWHPRSLLVYVNGILKRPYISDTEPGEFNISQINDTQSQIVFTSSVSSGDIISILHLGFSTVLRRSDYLTTVIASPNFIQTQHINNNAVTDEKILLRNNYGLRSLKSGGSQSEIIKLDSSDLVNIYDSLSIDKGTTVSTLQGKVLPLNIGTDSNKINKLTSVDINSDSIEAEAITVENLSITGAISGVGIDSVPVGAILPFYGKSSQIPSKYLLCDGTVVPSGSQYNTIREHLRVANDLGLSDTVYLPMGANNFLLGQKLPSQSSTVGLRVGETGGQFFHSHTCPTHLHSLSSSGGASYDLEIPDHTHGPGSFMVAIPNHIHYLNSHNHSIDPHSHITYAHFHILGSSGYGMLHGHNMTFQWCTSSSSSGGNTGFVRRDNVTVTDHIKSTDQNIISLAGRTQDGSISGGENQNTSSTSLSTGSPSNNSIYNWNSTRYNRFNNLDPGDMSQGANQTYNISGISGNMSSSGSATFSDSSVVGSASLSINNSNVVAVPYLTINFMIKAIA